MTTMSAYGFFSAASRRPCIAVTYYRKSLCNNLLYVYDKNILFILWHYCTWIFTFFKLLFIYPRYKNLDIYEFLYYYISSSKLIAHNFFVMRFIIYDLYFSENFKKRADRSYEVCRFQLYLFSKYLCFNIIIIIYLLRSNIYKNMKRTNFSPHQRGVSRRRMDFRWPASSRTMMHCINIFQWCVQFEFALSSVSSSVSEKDKILTCFFHLYVLQGFRIQQEQIQEEWGKHCYINFSLSAEC